MEFFINTGPRLHTLYRDNDGVSESFLHGEWAVVKTDSRWLDRQVKFGQVRSVPDPRAFIEESSAIFVKAITSKSIRAQLIAGQDVAIPIVSLDRWSLTDDEDDPDAVWVVQFSTLSRVAGNSVAFGVQSNSYSKRAAADKKLAELVAETKSSLECPAEHDMSGGKFSVYEIAKSDAVVWEQDAVERERREEQERAAREERERAEAIERERTSRLEREERERQEELAKFEAEKSELDALLAKKPSELTNEEYARRTRLKRMLRAEQKQREQGAQDNG